MLTGDLVRVSVRAGGLLAPGFVRVGNAAVVERAETICALFAEAGAGRWTRGELEEAVEAILGDEKDGKIVRGFAKVLLDRSTFEVDAPGDPLALRHQVFREARVRGPLGLENDRFGRPSAEDVLAAVGAEHRLSAEQVAAALYADLPDAQRLAAVPEAEPAWLVHRYNVALVQAVLLRAVGLRLLLHAPRPARLRQLLRHLKFHQLLFEARRVGEDLELRIDGPQSLFSQSTRYGMQLATFFPAILLQDGPWTLDATVLWGTARTRRTLTLSQQDGLISHYRDDGVWEPNAVTWLRERWAAQNSGWTLFEANEPVVLPGGVVLMPDFVLERDGKRALVEVVGFWRRAWLDARLEALRKSGPGNLILAVSRRLHSAKEELADFPGEVVDFAEVIPPKRLLEAAERVAR